MNLLDFFDIDFPIDRQSFIYRTLFLAAILACLYFFVGSELFAWLERTPQTVILFLFGLAISLFYATAIVKRSQDFDSSGVFVVLTYVAFVGFVAWTYLSPSFSQTVMASKSLPAFWALVLFQNLYLMIKTDSYSL